MSKYNSSQSQDSDIGELVRTMESDFTSGTTHVSKYVDMSLYEDISKVYAYLESKHTRGDTDTQGREKPFFNIVLASRNIWFRATDIDRSNIKVTSTKADDDINALFATVRLQDWMRRENFGQFLNSWGINMAGFNETVVKFVEKDKKLIPTVVPWNRLICDQVNFAANPKIEVLEVTPAELKKNKNYDKELVKSLLTAMTTREGVDGQTKDTKSDYIKLYEVHGEMPLSYLTGLEKDEDEYVQQMHVISFLASNEKGKHDDYTLYYGREEKDPYLLTALLPEIDGSIALRGSVKTLFDAQWMQNHTAKSIKDQLDLASKLVFQTSDGTFVGQNALSSIENGDILIHAVNQPLTQVANTSHDIVSLQNYGSMWKQLGNEITGVSDAMLGVAPKSGTAWKQTEAILQESHSLFELMTENKGLYIEEMMREYVIPYITKNLNDKKEIAALLKSHEITKIDARYIKNTAIKNAKTEVRERLLSGQDVTPEEHQQLIEANASALQEGLASQSKRYFSPDEVSWKEQLKDFEWDADVDVTNESVDKDAATTLNTLLTFFQNKQGQPMTPEERFVIEKILRLTGTVSTLELSQIPQSKPQPQQQPNTPAQQVPGAPQAPVAPPAGA